MNKLKKRNVKLIPYKDQNVQKGDDGITRYYGTISSVSHLLAELAFDEESPEELIELPEFDFCLVTGKPSTTLESFELNQSEFYGMRQSKLFDTEDQHLEFSYHGNGCPFATNLFFCMSKEEVANEIARGIGAVLENECRINEDTEIFASLVLIKEPDYEGIVKISGRSLTWAKEAYAAMKKHSEKSGRLRPYMMERLCEPHTFMREYESMWYTFNSFTELVEDEMDHQDEPLSGHKDPFKAQLEEVRRMMTGTHPSVFLGDEFVFQVCD